MRCIFLLTRFLLAGAVGAGVNVGLLYVLTDGLGLWYLRSAVISFVFATGVSFVLQKFWAFRENSRRRIPKQGFYFLSLAIFNLLVNAFLLYLWVDWLGLYYLLGQVVIAVIIAGWSFFIYSRLVFSQLSTPLI